MSEGMVTRLSAREWFREAVCDVLAHRSMRNREVTEFYLVNLLASFLDRGRLFVPDVDGWPRAQPLALILLEAQGADRERRARELRRLGDTALYLSGFFGDSLARSAAGVDYYIAMGERAYGALTVQRKPAEEDGPFAELAHRFPDFVNVLAEIAEPADLRSNRGLVRLYSRFLATGSERVAQVLRKRGVALYPTPARPRAKR